MKVLHLCLGNFYIDNYSYQENMLSKFHKKIGLEVEIIASLFSFDENGKGCFLKEGGRYINEHGIPVTRLAYKKTKLNRRLRRYEGTYDAIVRSKPDIIFIHGCQFLDIKHVVRYVKQHPEVRVYVDNHADFSNSARNWVSKNILHKIIWRRTAHMIEPYTIKFYGVLPARVDFLKEVYKIPENKIELLVMGADDDLVKKAKSKEVRDNIRDKYNIGNNDFLIVTGGKIDLAKTQTLLLMDAVRRINYKHNKHLKLIVFGSVVSELKEDVQSLCDDKMIQYVGWIQANEVYKYFAAADLVVFPGRHSVFWEQAVGVGAPMLVKHWDGTTHVDLGGNCEFLYEDSVEEIEDKLMALCEKEKLEKMRAFAEKEGMQEFSYQKIAARSIDISYS